MEKDQLVKSEVWYTPEQLVGSLAESDTPVSRAQLNRWRKLGLIPKPLISHPEFGGSTSLYSRRALDQCVELFQLLKKERNLEKVGFELYITGHAVETEAVRRCVVARLEHVLGFNLRRNLRTDKLNDIAQTIVNQVTASHKKRFTGTLISHEIADNGFDIPLIYACVQLLLGIRINLDSDVYPNRINFRETHSVGHLFEQVIPVMKDQISEPFIYALQDMVDTRWAALSEHLKYVSEASDEDFELARQQSIIFCSQFNEIIEISGADILVKADFWKQIIRNWNDDTDSKIVLFTTLLRANQAQPEVVQSICDNIKACFNRLRLVGKQLNE